MRQLLKNFTSKTNEARESIAAGRNPESADSAPGGYHSHMMTAVDSGDDGISESDMEAAMVKANLVAKDSRIATLERENEKLRLQVEESKQEKGQTSPSKVKETFRSFITNDSYNKHCVCSRNDPQILRTAI